MSTSIGNRYMRTRKSLLLFVVIVLFTVTFIYISNNYILVQSHFRGIPITHNGVIHIHQTWKTNKLPERFSKWSNTWKTCFPNATITLWTDQGNRDFIKRHYPWFLTHYDAFPRNIQRADVIRYFYMYHFGGIYTDMDTECLRPFHHLLEPYRLVFGAMEGSYPGVSLPEGHVQNSFMYSKPREKFWLKLIRKIMKRDKDDKVENSTGPDVLMEAIREYKKTSRRKDIVIYPPRFFNPFSWITEYPAACKTFNVMTDIELEKCREKLLNSYVIQYHAHTW